MMKQTNRKKLRSALSLLCALTMGTSVGMFAACGGNENTGNDAKAIASYVSLDINPSIELTVDSENKVLSVYGGNEDGQVLLYEETLRGYAKDMNAKAEAMLTKIKGELTEEELAEVDAEIAKIVADFEDEKAEMESKIAQAAEEAKAKLAELKAKRKTAE